MKERESHSLFFLMAVTLMFLCLLVGQPKDQSESLTICGGGTLNIMAGSWEKAASGISIGKCTKLESVTIKVKSKKRLEQTHLKIPKRR